MQIIHVLTIFAICFVIIFITTKTKRHHQRPEGLVLGVAVQGIVADTVFDSAEGSNIHPTTYRQRASTGTNARDSQKIFLRPWFAERDLLVLGGYYCIS